MRQGQRLSYTYILKGTKSADYKKIPKMRFVVTFLRVFYVLFLSFLYIKNLCYTLCNKNTKIVYVSLIWSYPTKQCMLLKVVQIIGYYIPGLRTYKRVVPGLEFKKLFHVNAICRNISVYRARGSSCTVA